MSTVAKSVLIGVLSGFTIAAITGAWLGWSGRAFGRGIGMPNGLEAAGIAAFLVALSLGIPAAMLGGILGAWIGHLRQSRHRLERIVKATVENDERPNS